jgi:hypothetical protein
MRSRAQNRALRSRRTVGQGWGTEDRQPPALPRRRWAVVSRARALLPDVARRVHSRA